MIPREDFLLTDLYQLAMVEAYLDAGETGTATFEFFVRALPRGRNFLMAAGLDQALGFLEDLQVGPEARAWLEATGRFDAGFIEALKGFRFSGDVHAMPEGTVFFPDEPILRVVAPLPEAQYVETRLINLVHFQTVIASTAARMTLAAAGRQLVDFGLRRAHGAEAGLLAARASHLAGFAGSATVLAGRRFGVPIFGTMAHSFVQAFDSEEVAFTRFARARPDGVVLLIDTYDTEEGARIVARLAPRLAREGIGIGGVRLDSGDLDALSRSVRAILDSAGLARIRIFASGGLDAARIDALVRAGAPIDGFGVGTSLTTASDAPALDCAYKLQDYAGAARRKRSPGKATWPGRKQVWRRFDDAGGMIGDTIALEDETHAGTALLQPVMRAGRRVEPAEPMAAMRERARRNLAALPAGLKTLAAPDAAYPVSVSEPVRALAATVDARLDAARQGDG